MQALILAGGKGERLRPLISGIPKPMASINKKPFLEFLICQLSNFTINDIILCIGYKGEFIKEYFQDGTKWSVNIQYSEEEEPLGTGGAVRNALSLIKTSPIIVMNGDSFIEVDIHNMVKFHKRNSALITIALVSVNDTSRYGRISIDDESKIISFNEKESGNKGLINSGFYIIEKNVIESIGQGFVSIERDVFPQYIGKEFYGFIVSGFFIDIGVPEDYLWMQKNSKTLLKYFNK